MSRQNENKASSATEVTENSTQSEQLKASADQQIQSRRSMIGAGLAGLATAVVAACSGTDFASTGGKNRLKGKKPPNSENFDGDGQDGVDNNDGVDAPEGGGTAEAGEAEGEDPKVPTKVEIDKCAATSPQKIDTTGMPAIESAPVVRIYGKRTSRMVAIQFTAATTFDQLLVLGASGRVIALHVPSGADKNATGWRPIVIDPLNFDEGGAESAEVVIVLQQGNDRKQHREALKNFDKFDGKDVIDLAAGTTGTSWDHTKQSVARFKASAPIDPAGYVKDDNPSIIYPPATPSGALRKLKTAQQNVALTVSATLLKSGQKPIPTSAADGKITDIMGNIIAHTELEGAGLLETPLFCTYRLTTDGSKYIRTMIYVA